MMLRDDYSANLPRDTENDKTACVAAPLRPVGAKASKWSDPSRIVLAPRSDNIMQETVETMKKAVQIVDAPVAVAVTKQTTVEKIAAPVAELAASLPPVAAVIEAPIVTSTPVSSSFPRASSTMSTSELTTLESQTKDLMQSTGQACMAAWTAALEASRAYRAIRKEWRRAKHKLDKRNERDSLAEPKLTLQDAATDANDSLPAPLLLSNEALDEPLVEEVEVDTAAELQDEVEEMEQAVHDVERAELQYSALVDPEDAQAEDEADEEAAQQQVEGSTAETMETGDVAPTQTGRPHFEVMSFSFGGSSSARPPVARRAVVSSTMSASDRARALALRAKLEADMLAHEQRRLQLQEAQRLKQVEFERRRVAAKEKAEEVLHRRTHNGKLDEAERKRGEAESRRHRAVEEDKKSKVTAKLHKRKELEQQIEELKAKERTHSKKKTTTH